MTDRQERVEQVQACLASGASRKNVAAALGLSMSYVNELINDPTGEKVAARKASYRGICEGCGRPTTGSNGRAGASRLCLFCGSARLTAAAARVQAERARPRRERIQQLWADGLTQVEIAHELGMRPSTLNKAMTAMRRAGWALPYRRIPPHFTGTRAA